MQEYSNLSQHTCTCLHAATECTSANKGSDAVLNDEVLKAMTNVFTHESNNLKTYLYVPKKEAGKTGHELIFRSTGADSGINHAEDNMFNTLKPNLPQEFWLTKTPCPGCARNLIARYEKSKEKPVIHVVHFYSRPPSGETQKEKSIQCMALMIKKGFTFLLWDWNKFSKDFLPVPLCKKIVSNAMKNKEYAKQLKAEQDALLAAIMKASNYADELNENELCKP